MKCAAFHELGCPAHDTSRVSSLFFALRFSYEQFGTTKTFPEVEHSFCVQQVTIEECLT